MDDMFGSMVTTTAPGVFDGQRRGVIYGGSIRVRNPIVKANLVAFAPPSFKAGCGGVDAFGGSFSFVNSDQLVSLFRAVAANAKGYAFQLALSAMNEKASKWIESLQRKIQQMNELMNNSCQMAQGIVDFGKDAIEGKVNMESSLASAQSGLGDFFTNWGDADGQTPKEGLKASNPTKLKEEIVGNLIWRQLKKNNAASYFAGGDDAILEAIMTYTGTLVVGDMVVQADGSEDTPKTTYAAEGFSLEALLKGGNVSMLVCDTTTKDGCLVPTITTVDLNGISERLYTELLGGPSTSSVVDKIASSIAAFSTADMNLLGSLPLGYGGMVMTLSKRDTKAATHFIRATHETITLSLAYELVKGLLDAVNQANSDNDHAHAKDIEQLLEKAENRLRDEHFSLRQKVGSEKDVLEHYTRIVELLPKRDYLPAFALGPTTK
tara:strand:- start:13 stop:1320 length:1308 start_codon:yes stop_codon:yes gene_type:complete